MSFENPMRPDNEGGLSISQAWHKAMERAEKAESDNVKLSTAYNDLMGQIRAMKELSDKYAHEAAADAEISESEKHMRVFCVLQELERLGQAFRNR